MQREPFKKRWFILDSQDRKLLYFKDPLEAVEKGSVFIGNKEHGYKVTNVLPKGVRGSRWKCGITVETPERQFIFTCENEREQREWMEALNQVISKPMSPQDYTTGSFVLQWKPTSDEGDDIGGAAADISEELDLELCCPGGP
ncbi:Arf-GAP with dual PH domain-containing protein 2 [Acipenser ruthenus]|uniref:Arf-GAP with dual PH domain-containing protein 2 n=1 Tax=Acipenser ruthenus TaxID=7906 RepID=A0A662YTP5_ACIRT|nr:Arf-GAP with dual PH domain-containing protein 2 [Acipenser ruthenus]